MTSAFGDPQLAVGPRPEVEIGVDPVVVGLGFDDGPQPLRGRLILGAAFLQPLDQRLEVRLEGAFGDDRGAEAVDVLAAVEAEGALQVDERIVERIVRSQPPADAVAAVDELLHRPLDHEVARCLQRIAERLAQRAAGILRGAGERVLAGEHRQRLRVPLVEHLEVARRHWPRTGTGGAGVRRRRGWSGS